MGRPMPLYWAVLTVHVWCDNRRQHLSRAESESVGPRSTTDAHGNPKSQVLETRAQAKEGRRQEIWSDGDQAWAQFSPRR